ncbi:MAG: DUF977 family protein [Candidatus Methanoperedens sp.]|nr:DUF977 family protein [Candidatus Methanoperedens sp.]
MRKKRMIREKTMENVREETGEKIINLIKENPKITTKELADKTGLSVKSIEWNIKELKDKGLLRRIGADRGGHWEVVVNNENEPDNPQQ